MSGQLNVKFHENLSISFWVTLGTKFSSQKGGQTFSKNSQLVFRISKKLTKNWKSKISTKTALSSTYVEESNKRRKRILHFSVTAAKSLLWLLITRYFMLKSSLISPLHYSMRNFDNHANFRFLLFDGFKTFCRKSNMKSSKSEW